ncbi:hypothetical protein WJX72_002599 [[Myrmecia] bisecta]|uniref:Uncharacterized protein n=1 Tax=[Myrmecia] bisecta TaxID=41462 RepID=A0AAW1Q6R1_9CHLO
MVYADPPWTFRGRALYQLQLVKAEEAKKYVPEGFQLVSLFGYTLGGFYLARYSDSPVGAFDELVALGGLVWNFPTSCAWAARVYVNSWDARVHGRRHVGLPSRLATFSEDVNKPGIHRQSWWRCPHSVCHQIAAGKRSAAVSSMGADGDYGVIVRNVERRPWWQPWACSPQRLQGPVCFLALPAAGKGWPGPRVHMVLPSFSGNTPDHPGLLKYGVQLRANVRPVKPAHVQAATPRTKQDEEAMGLILGGRPVLTLAFEDMEMSVAEPSRWTLEKE